MALNRVVVIINGVRYPIKTIENPDYVNELAQQMNIAVHNLMLSGSLSLNEALVLIGLEYLDSFKKSNTNLDNMRSQLSEYMEDAALARQELSSLKRELERLKNNSGDRLEATV